MKWEDVCVDCGEVKIERNLLRLIVTLTVRREKERKRSITIKRGEK